MNSLGLMFFPHCILEGFPLKYLKFLEVVCQALNF